ncbi:hypothetical protein Btru_070074 [Bulinus truncatus]|nr:hypothetical protein Btru_070074 [Bulinus truncatus]
MDNSASRDSQCFHVDSSAFQRQSDASETVSASMDNSASRDSQCFHGQQCFQRQQCFRDSQCFQRQSVIPDTVSASKDNSYSRYTLPSTCGFELTVTKVPSNRDSE